MVPDYVLLSKTIAHALRHRPWLYELELDEEGWTAIEPLLEALRRRQQDWKDLNERDLYEMIASSEKRRFEMAGGRIRAVYGHSIPGTLRRIRATPPEILYHGTSPVAARRILVDGLLPMNRQYVHLSTNVATAMEVGRRKTAEPVVLRIHASQAACEGVCFYEGNEQVWLADNVPAKFIEVSGEGPTS
jgi:putative RNA 2'-phosphotransferase